MRKFFLLALLLILAGPAGAAEADLYWLGGTSSTGVSTWIPVSNANPMPTTGGGGGTGCVPAGGSAATNIITYGVAGTCAPDTLANLINGALTLGASGTLGSVIMGNATSGLVTLQPQAGALGSVTVLIPAANDTLVNLAGSQALTNKTYNGLTITTSTGTLTIPNGITLNAGPGGTLGTGAFVNTGTSGATIGLLNGNNTYSGNDTFSGTLLFSGLSAGTQVACLGLDSGNHVVLLASACGAGGGSWNLTDGTTSLTGVTALTVPGGTLKVGGTPGAATLTPIVTEASHAGSFSSWNVGGQDDMSATGTATLPTFAAGQSALLTAQSGVTVTVGLNSQTVNGLGLNTTLHQFGFYSYTYDSAGVASAFGFPGYGTITSGALMKFLDASGAATSGDLSGDATTSGSLVTTVAKINGTTVAASAVAALGNATNTAGGMVTQPGTLTANLPVIGGGSGTGVSIGSRTGNTTQFATWTGATTGSKCVDTDASGNLQVTASDCNTGGTGGTPATGNTTAVTVNANTTGDQLLQELHPANGAFNTANMVLKLHQSGIYTVLGTPQVTVKAKLCSSSNSGCITLATITAAATVSASNDQFIFETSCGISATGASGTLICHGTQLIDLTSGSVVASPNTDNNTAVSSAFDLTGANFIDFTISFSSGSALNTATGQLAYVSPLGMGGTVTSVTCGTGLTGGTITATGTCAPDFGTAANKVAQGGVITAGGPTGSATVAPIITYNAAGQLTTVSSATITPAIGSVTGLGTNVGAALGATLSAAGGVSSTIASGTSAMGTSAISSATCATVVTTSATNTATTDVIWWGFNGDPTGVTGYVPATAGMLTIIAYPSANNVNFKVCNNSSSSISPGAITLNWRVIR